MARKCKEEAEKTYGLLVDAAEEIFSTKGYARATFQEIAEHAGLTRGAVYWHFSDKHQLLEAVLRRAQLPWDRLPEHYSSQAEAPSRAQLANVIGSALSEINDDPRLHRVVLILLHRTELVTDNHQVYCRLTTILDRIKTWLVASLSWHCHNPDGTPHRNIPTVVAAVNALLTGITYEWLLGQREMEAENIPRTIECLFTSYLGEPTECP